MTYDGERIASLEAHAETASEQRQEIVTRLNSQDKDLAAIRKDVHEIKETVASYKGFFAGFAFALASLGGLVGAAVTAAWHRLFP
jgi:hypothetical protein